MDPNATLYLLLSSLHMQDREDSIAALVNLTTWLRKGGAFPQNVEESEEYNNVFLVIDSTVTSS